MGLTKVKNVLKKSAICHTPSLSVLSFPRVGLALAIALDVGWMCGNGMCQRRGRESLPVAVRWESQALLFIMCRLFYVPCFLILYLVGGV